MRQSLLLLIGLAIVTVAVWVWFWVAKNRIHGGTSYPIPSESGVGVAKPKTLPMLKESP